MNVSIFPLLFFLPNIQQLLKTKHRNKCYQNDNVYKDLLIQNTTDITNNTDKTSPVVTL